MTECSEEATNKIIGTLYKEYNHLYSTVRVVMATSDILVLKYEKIIIYHNIYLIKMRQYKRWAYGKYDKDGMKVFKNDE